MNLNPTLRIRASKNRNSLQIKAGISKVGTTTAHMARACAAVILGGNCTGSLNLSFSKINRWSGSGCV